MSPPRSRSTDLSQTFTDPLKNVDPLYVEDSKEMESVIADLEFKLSNPDDWSIRAEAMREAMSYIKGGICEYENCDFASLASGVAACLTDARSSLVKTACLLVASCARVLKERYVTSTQIVLPALFRPLSHGTAIIANSCHAAIIEIAKHVQHRRALTMVLSSGASRTVEHRLAVVESLIIVLQTWPNSVLAPMLKDVGLQIHKFIVDSSPGVRQTAKEARVLFDEKALGAEGMAKTSKSPVVEARKPRTPKLGVVSNLSKSLTSFSKSPPVSKTQEIASPSKLKRAGSPRHVPASERKPKLSSSTLDLSPRRASSSLRKREPVQPPEELVVEKRFSTPTKSPVRTSASGLQKRQNSPKKVVPYRPPSRNAVSPERPKTMKAVPATEKKMRRCFSPAPKKSDPTKRQLAQTPKTPNSVRFVDKVELPDSANGGKPRSIMKPSRSPTPTKALRTSPVLPPPPEKVGIEEYMPPKTMDQAEKFQEMLSDIVDMNAYEDLVGLEDLLPQSIVAAIDFIPQFEEWESILRRLFVKYQEFFLAKIHELIQAFKFKEDVIGAAVESFTSQTIFDHFCSLPRDQDDVVLKFTNVFFAMHHDVDITEENRERLGELGQECGAEESVEQLQEEKEEQEEEEYEEPDVDPRALVDAFIAKVSRGQDASQEETALYEYLKRDELSEFPKQIQAKLCALLKQGSESERIRVFGVVKTTPLLSLDRRIDVALSYLVTEDSDFQKSVKQFLVEQMNDRDLLVKILRRVSPASDAETRNQAILGCVLEYTTSITPQKMIEIVPVLFEHILPVFTWTTIALRRLAIQIAVEFNVKIPAEFAAYMSKISMVHQNLIAVYTTKRRH